MKNGARRDQAARSPPTAGPLIPPTRNPPENRPLARPRCSSGTLTSSNVWALTLNIAEPQATHPAQDDELQERTGQPGQRAAGRHDRDADGHHPVLAEAVNQPPGGQGPDHAQQGEGTDHAGGRGGAHPEVTGERGDVRGHDPEPERDRERDRRENGHLRRHVAERSG